MAYSFGTVHCATDFDSVGQRTGHFSVCQSDDRYGFSTIQSPLAVLKSAKDGPTVLICAGNHGDEYEGQIIVRRLFERLSSDDITGRLILAPALNMPAVIACSRVSPLDGGNLNRSFPGMPFAGPTQDIAGFFATQLMPMADLAIDIHSGGKLTNYVDAAYFCLTHDPERNAQTRELCTVMGLPYTMVVPVSDTLGDFDSAAHAAGCAMISCELGGEGKINLASLEVGWQGVLRLLVHQGVLSADTAKKLGASRGRPTNFLDHGPQAQFITGHTHGLAEPLGHIGDVVVSGQPLIRVRNLHNMDAPPLELTSPIDGRIAILRAGAIVCPGDHLCVICPGITPQDLDAHLTHAAP